MSLSTKASIFIIGQFRFRRDYLQICKSARCFPLKLLCSWVICNKNLGSSWGFIVRSCNWILQCETYTHPVRFMSGGTAYERWPPDERGPVYIPPLKCSSGERDSRQVWCRKHAFKSNLQKPTFGGTHGRTLPHCQSSVNVSARLKGFQ